MNATTARTKVLLMFGGRSSEHSISCVTAGGVMRALNRERYEVIPVGITAEGRMVAMADDPAPLSIVDGHLPVVPATGPEVIWPRQAGDRQMRLLRDGRVEDWSQIDVVFPLLHGPYGEDGTIQGALELLDLPYVGSGVLASAMGMDKAAMKTAFSQAGLAQGAYEVITPAQWRDQRSQCEQRVRSLGLPVFVKPARAGSSFGISRVGDLAELEEAILAAQKHDPKVIVEAGIDGREIECAVLGSAGGRAPRTTAPGEITVHAGDHAFYDFEAKYLDAQSVTLSIPAVVPDDVASRVRRDAARAFQALGCEGLARVDFFVCPDGRVLINEVNTMPGFTPTSMYSALWAHEGLGYSELLDELIELALTRPIGLR